MILYAFILIFVLYNFFSEFNMEKKILFSIHLSALNSILTEKIQNYMNLLKYIKSFGKAFKELFDIQIVFFYHAAIFSALVKIQIFFSSF